MYAFANFSLLQLFLAKLQNGLSEAAVGLLDDQVKLASLVEGILEAYDRVHLETLEVHVVLVQGQLVQRLRQAVRNLLHFEHLAG